MRHSLNQIFTKENINKELIPKSHQPENLGELYLHISRALSFFTIVPLFWLCYLLLMLSGCSENKFDYLVDNRASTAAIESSKFRIVNLRGANQVIANGDSLTGFILKDPHAPDASDYPGTKYFTKNGKMGKLWQIPQDVFDASDSLKLKIETYSYNFFGAPVEFSIQKKTAPTDYYLLQAKGYFIDEQPDMVAIPRDTKSPARPDCFKIRLLNLSCQLLATNVSGMEHLNGPLQLTWADGTPVSDKLNNIKPGEYSEYIEVPYGTYQFKVLTPDGRQLPGQEPDDYYIIDPSTSSICTYNSANQPQPTYQTYAPIHAYKPGGIYTIVVSAQSFKYPYPGSTTNEQLAALQNGFEIIADVDEPVNTTYARVQFINALPEDGAVTLTLNGKEISEAGVTFGNVTDYATLINGNYTVEAMDPSGKVLASTTSSMSAGDNYSVWLSNSDTGNDSLIVVANNLSGSMYSDTGDGQDASYDRFNRPYFLKLRFLNFDTDFEYLSFTTDNGQAFSSTIGLQLKPNYVPKEQPYVSLKYETLNSFQIMAYRSTATTAPGAWADEIPVLTSQDLIPRPELYSRGIPALNTGVYTIALIGRKTDDDRYKSKMIIITHTK